MFARVTLFEIDTLRIGMDAALERFKEQILPIMEKQEGYQGSYVMDTPEGKGLLVTFWATEAAAQAGIESGYYDEQISKFVSFFRAPAGRENYEVVFEDSPSKAAI
ncbi:MAG: hypothetical protein H8E48_14865 [Chloroflexi bacterium]|nr:hypothetical protein [Chloroflexota bacterium]